MADNKNKEDIEEAVRGYLQQLLTPGRHQLQNSDTSRSGRQDENGTKNVLENFVQPSMSILQQAGATGDMPTSRPPIHHHHQQEAAAQMQYQYTKPKQKKKSKQRKPKKKVPYHWMVWRTSPSPVPSTATTETSSRPDSAATTTVSRVGTPYVEDVEEAKVNGEVYFEDKEVKDISRSDVWANGGQIKGGNNQEKSGSVKREDGSVTSSERAKLTAKISRGQQDGQTFITGRQTPTNGRQTPTNGRQTPTNGRQTPTINRQTATNYAYKPPLSALGQPIYQVNHQTNDQSNHKTKDFDTTRHVNQVAQQRNHNGTLNTSKSTDSGTDTKDRPYSSQSNQRIQPTITFDTRSLDRPTTSTSMKTLRGSVPMATQVTFKTDTPVPPSSARSETPSFVPVMQSWADSASQYEKDVAYNLFQALNSGAPIKVPRYNKTPGKHNFLSWPMPKSRNAWREENKVIFKPRTAGIKTTRPKYANPINCPGDDPPARITESVQIVGESMQGHDQVTNSGRPSMRSSIKKAFGSYIHENSFFMNSQQPYRSCFTIHPDWVSETKTPRSSKVVKKNINPNSLRYGTL